MTAKREKSRHPLESFKSAECLSFTSDGKPKFTMEQFDFPVGCPEFNAPGAPRSFSQMVNSMVELEASDLHLKTGFPAFVRLLDTHLYPFTHMDPIEADEIFGFIEEILLPERYRVFRETGDADFVYPLLGGERFRINSYMSMGMPSMAVRHVKSRIPSMQDLGLPWIISRFASPPPGFHGAFRRFPDSFHQRHPPRKPCHVLQEHR